MSADCQLVIMGPFGRVDLTHVTGFDVRQLTALIRVDRPDGSTLSAELPKGWGVSFNVERGASWVDEFLANVAAYGGNEARPTGTSYQYLAEPDGSTSTYQFDECVFRLGPTGQKQRVEFFAARRKRI